MKKIFTICFLIITSQLFSQDNTIDSLKQRVSKANRSKKILELNELAIAYWNVNPAKSVTLGNEALQLANQLKYYKVKARTYNIIGAAYSHLKKYTLDEFQVKYETEKKDHKIKLQEATIKNKALIFRYSLAGASAIFVALLIIIFLYRKRNQAYRHLVYLNLKTFDKKLNDPCEEGGNNIQGYHNTIDSVLKQQIATRLDQLMESKIYLEAGITINYLSERCDTNRSYLSQIIHEEYQMNFNNFINKYRIEEAKRLLIEPGNVIPLKALHERLGFSSYTRFHEAFKKYTGVTPTFFLKTIKAL